MDTKKNIYQNIKLLLDYAKENNLICKEDEIVSRNSILDILKIDDWEEYESKNEDIPNYPNEILDEILEYAIENMIIEDTITQRDLLDTRIMGVLTPRASEINKNFNELAKNNIKDATNYYYNLAKKLNYIRMNRIEKNKYWRTNTPYGEIEITINLSKPEKDPREIAKAREMKTSKYPKCLLCYENVGFAGNLNRPARQNHRVIPFALGGEPWYMQYSPYVYYNEHAIIFCKNHRPMKINKDSFSRLLEFTEKMPHYFIGSNADLPIVGGSILSHDHYQGGNHDFPMAKAMVEMMIHFNDFPNVNAAILNWPMSVIRISSKNKEDLVKLADKILMCWRDYSDETQGIIAKTESIPHNTITPIARRRNENFEMDLVLRNNRTDDRNPLGIFHPHEDVHNIKKENIGLIEVMGLAVLPGRLKEEMQILKELLLKENAMDEINKNEKVKIHANWAQNILLRYENINEDNIDTILKDEIGLTFAKGLEDAGVFKKTPMGQIGFIKFVNYVNSK